MIVLKNHLRWLILLGMLELTACVSNLTQGNLPTSQLTQSLSHSPVRLQQENNTLKITMLVDQAFLPHGSHLTPATKQDLFKIAQTLHDHPELKVKVSAYTDNRGSLKSSQLVSLRRAMIIADAFRNAGIASSRISIHGMGAVNPIASNNTAEGRASNKRIEIILWQ